MLPGGHAGLQVLHVIYVIIKRNMRSSVFVNYIPETVSCLFFLQELMKQLNGIQVIGQVFSLSGVLML